MSSPSSFTNECVLPINSAEDKILSSESTDNHDALSRSLACLTINSASSNLSSELPRTPISGRSLPKSPLISSPITKGLKSRSSTSSVPRKTSLSPFDCANPTRIRRSLSTQFVNASTLVGKTISVGQDEASVPPRQTPESIAREYFKADLETFHEKEDCKKNTDTIVILHDSCYGHRYSRPRTSKAAFSTIFERPERIHASILGISIAYVRLGELYAGARNYIHPQKDPAEEQTMPFRICRTTRKLLLSSNIVTNVHGSNWMKELKTMCEDADARLAMSGKELVRPERTLGSDSEKPPATLHEGDLYLCSESLNSIEGALGAVCEGVDVVFQGAAKKTGPRRAFVAIRPPGHHCSASHPSGFCWINNIHVGISYASLTYDLTHAVIIDFDLHHGDGSQSIAWEINKRTSRSVRKALDFKKPLIGYFSVHDINSYPCEMGDEEKVKNASLCIENSHGQSIWNVHLQPWKTEAEFWGLYEKKYSVLLEKARSFLRAQTKHFNTLFNKHTSKAAIFISAGFDASEWESPEMQRHKVNVPTDFYARLTRDVVRLASEEETAVEGRIISVLEGGYSDKALITGVLSHISGMAAKDSNQISLKSRQRKPLHDDHLMNNHLNLSNTTENTAINVTKDYDSSWWSKPCLEELDAVQNPQLIAEPKTKRDGPTTFSSPTQSFISKVTASVGRNNTPEKLNKAIQSNRLVTSAPSQSLEVNWAVAANELSKLLIPTGRQTISCKPEDLTAEAMRRKFAQVRKDDHSLNNVKAIPMNNEGSGRMALRSRKPVKVVSSSKESEAKNPVLKTNQKKTNPAAGQVENKKKKSTPESTRSTSLSSSGKTRLSEDKFIISNSRTTNNPNSKRARSSVTSRSETSLRSSDIKKPPESPKKSAGSAKSQQKSDGSNYAENRVEKKFLIRKDIHGDPKVVLDKINEDGLKSKTYGGFSIKTSAVEDDIDNLTSSMKKVTISLVTKRQRAAREKENVRKQAGVNHTAKMMSFSSNKESPKETDFPSPSTIEVIKVESKSIVSHSLRTQTQSSSITEKSKNIEISSSIEKGEEHVNLTSLGIISEKPPTRLLEKKTGEPAVIVNENPLIAQQQSLKQIPHPRSRTSSSLSKSSLSSMNQEQEESKHALVEITIDDNNLRLNCNETCPNQATNHEEQDEQNSISVVPSSVDLESNLIKSPDDQSIESTTSSSSSPMYSSPYSTTLNLQPSQCTEFLSVPSSRHFS
ncbi:putative histone deacetylase domain-containing protein [Golovinomyces cichoracearum]|uniref:Putative histone deacetylase domain-containing protein n=1 Tax=Golovinomyces cichoracearum TaxID=62708 RepID=A0A420IDS8_9PEZI|nr:putative histone deacetylase domain-containing protein [Golovinomyces cichoracearum]